MEPYAKLISAVAAAAAAASAFLAFGRLLRDWWRARRFREHYRVAHYDEKLLLESQLASDPRMAELTRPVGVHELLKVLVQVALLIGLLFVASWWRSA